ncbi:hypothetical protein D3C81_1052600 [compost metagenome]
MHAQGAGSGGDVAFVLGQHALDVFPLQAVHGHRVFRHQAVEVGVFGQQRGQYVVGVGRFAQVVAGAALDRFDGGGNARITGEDHHAHFRVHFQQLGQQHQAGIAVHLQVQGGVIRQIGLGQLQAFLGGTGSADAKTAASHGAGHDAGECGVVIDQQQMRQFFAFDLDLFTHVRLLGRHGAGAAR